MSDVTWCSRVSSVTTCWALMLACRLAGHMPPAIACAAMVSAAERYGARPARGLTSAGLVGVALIYAAVAESVG